MKLEKLKTTTIVDKELEAEILQTSNELKATAKENGKNLAKNQLPRLSGDTLEPYILTLKSGFKSIYNGAKKRLQVDRSEEENREDVDYTKGLVQAIERKIEEVKFKRKPLEVELEKLGKLKSFRNYYFAFGISVLLFLSEVAIDSSALQALGFPLAVSMAFSLAIASSVFIISHKMRDILNLIENNKLKIAAFIAITAFLGLAFFIIASFRVGMGQVSLHTDQSGTAMSEGLKVLGFVVLNLVVFLGATLIMFFTKPTKEDYLKRDAQNELLNAIQALDTEIHKLQEDAKLLEEDLYMRQVSRGKNLEYAKHILATICTEYEACIGEFKSENLLYRFDGMPDCFKNELNPLFNNINQTK